MTTTLLSLLLAAAALAAGPVADAFSAPASSDGGIQIVGLPGGQIQSLPSMYVNSFRRWIVDDDVDDGTSSSESEEGKSSAAGCASMEPLPGAGLANLDEGWVNPTSTSELWWPKDLDAVQVRPALNVLFRNGRVSYVSAGLDVRVPRTTAAGKEGGEEVAIWRNYGLHSQPIAWQWTSLDVAMEQMFHVEGFILDNDNGGGEVEHRTLFPSLQAQSAMQRVATFIAELDPLSPLAEGFHIASFPMMQEWTDLPRDAPTPARKKGAGEGKVEDDTEALYRIVCLATSEPFANQLLELDEDVLTMSSTSVLEVTVSRTARGGDSPYLTEPYKGLYLSKS